MRECFGTYPGGLARPSPAPLAPAEIARRLDLCEPDVRPVLDRLLWAPAGQVRDAQRAVDPAAARTPVEQLLAYGLLRPVDATTVVLPREVALYLRGGRLTPEPVAPTPPPVPHTPGEAGRIDLVDRAAAGAAHELLHDLELAVEALDAAPHRLLRDGGVASRDTAGMARRLGLDV
ncbi:MAG: DEAD/DEAH box helicase, partial [Actinomycetes bacterium]